MTRANMGEQKRVQRPTLRVDNQLWRLSMRQPQFRGQHVDTAICYSTIVGDRDSATPLIVTLAENHPEPTENKLMIVNHAELVRRRESGFVSGWFLISLISQLLSFTKMVTRCGSDSTVGCMAGALTSLLNSGRASQGLAVGSLCSSCRDVVPHVESGHWGTIEDDQAPPSLSGDPPLLAGGWEYTMCIVGKPWHVILPADNSAQWCEF